MKVEDKEKAINFFKKNKKVKRIDFWNFLKELISKFHILNVLLYML